MFTPSFDEFREKSQKGNLIPVYREIMADLETPVTAFLKVAGGEYSFLLESVEGGEKWGRYCFLGGNPSVVLRSRMGRVTLTKNGTSEEVDFSGNPLDYFRKFMEQYKPVEVDGLPRFYGGAVGYIGYDVVRFIEDLPVKTDDDLNLDEMVFLITDTIIIFDNIRQKIKVVSNALTSEGSLEESYASAKAKIDAIVDALEQPLKPSVSKSAKSANVSKPLKLSSNVTKERYIEGVKRCKEYIKDGDIFQVVLSQRLEEEVGADPFDLYRTLRTVNPSPYMYFLKLGDIHVIGSSPEVLVRVEGDKVELRPIAGTKPRGATEKEDLELERILLSDEKERAEHIMLVDLGRNDIGRVSEAGTVVVDEMMVIERYSHVMHMVSNVKGKLKKGDDSFSVVNAAFPAGTLSGSPKIRAMEIIEEIEPTRRGVYGGAVGYFGFSGNMDMAIAIRTIVLKGRKAYIGVGAGIVADSDPESEYQETVNKGMAMLRTIEIAEGGTGL
ncbi:MAG: anthranilate synthase component I [Nitrospinota bacterium]